MTTRQKTLIEVITGLSLAGFAAVVWKIAEGFFAPVQADPLGPSFWPKILAWGMALLSLANVAHVLLRRLRAKEPEDSPPSEDTASDAALFSAWRFGGILALVLLYDRALPVLGYVLATPPFILAVLLVLGIRGWKDLVVPTVGLPLVWAVLFQVVLGVPLPEGVLALWSK